MKSILFTLILAASIAFSQGVQLKLIDYQLSAGSLLKVKGGKIGFATMNTEKNAKPENAFGFWITSNTNANTTFVEVKDGNRSIAVVSAKDFAAKAKASAGGLVYKSGTGANAVEIAFTSEAASDATMPLGKTIAVTMNVKAPAAKTLSATVSLYGDGFVQKTGANGAATSRVEKSEAVYPLVFLTGGEGTSVSVVGTDQKKPGSTVKISSASVAGRGATSTPVLSFRIGGSTVRNVEKAAAQAANAETAFLKKQTKTELAVVNTANKSNPFPGDTVTYTIYFTNIGTAFAQDIEISNPVPESMMFVEGSAGGADAEIVYDRKPVAAPQQGEVQVVRWKIKRRIDPGEEGSVYMKAIVR